MIAIDFSQIYLAPIFLDGAAKSCAQNPSKESRDMMLHYAINSVRSNFVAHGTKYGNMVIACDKGSWRRDVFEEYKWARRDKRKDDTSGIDWKFVGETGEYVKQVLKEYFPFVVVEVPNLEADDIIGVLAKMTNESTTSEENIFGETESEPFLIISSDGDHYQLHQYSNVKQWSPTTKKLVKSDLKPRHALINKIVKGDVGDGIPNIKSPNNTFVDKIRQKPISEKYLATFYALENPIEACLTEQERINYKRNEQLVSYAYTPKDLANQAILVYNEEKVKKHNKMKLMTFLAENKLNILYSKIGDFYK
jgi:hypothetical protein